ncbi:baculoviral IAP repeat-containing protein 3-like [Mercenaria mercenaria]|uniref:baculoviral IAP repeat-containing protein 3-like n=1 Tax=Mercenaria mercenaria TaxID=6596 RepID=UPI00234F110E|nr:baculoviral IAP repeat-containing protein 3-like [Mercenaria mercenaria]
MYQYRPNKNASVRLRQAYVGQNKSTVNSSAAYNKVDPLSTKCGTIRIIPTDEDPDSAVMSLELLAECFIEGLILFDYGKITVYLNQSADFLSDIENTAFAEQREFSHLHDVYVTYKTFLTYRNRYGKILILPKNQSFFTIFKRLNEGIYDGEHMKPDLSVLLKDFYRQKELFQRNETKNDGPECCEYYVSGPMVETCRHIQSHMCETENQLDESNRKCREFFSLRMSKRKIYFGIKRVAKPLLQRFGLLPRLPPPLSREKIAFHYPLEGQFKFPVQVSDEQRDDEARNEQVVPTYHSIIYRDDISYGLASQSGNNNGVYTPVTNNTQSAIRETEDFAQQRPRIPPRHSDYSHYADRLISFARWFHRRPDSATLSQAGFFFTNQGDLVRCFQCGIGLKDFSPDDDPLLEHVRHSRQCPFLSELLGDDGLAMYQDRLQAVDPEYNRRQQWAERQSGSAPRSSYRHPEYQAMHVRFSSFTNWPEHMMQTPQQLAEAGLYYTGFEDQVRCFACDGGLRRWDPEDDPWTEHCRWFPACPYALEQKGEQFIALVQASVENEGYGASGGSVHDLTSTMEQLRLQESLTESIMTQHRAVCVDMGYKEDDVKNAVQELLERGKKTPSLEDIIVLIDVIRERKQDDGHSIANETPLEENQRLKRIVFCMKCGKNNVNALFLPCTHHELCMSCADPLEECPVCQRGIRDKIRTYMV